MRHARAVLLGLLGLVLVLQAGCGFRLRGRVEIPPEYTPLLIQAPWGSAVERALRDRLTGSQVRLTTNPAEAKLTLRILAEKRAERVAAVDLNGKTLAYELHYLVDFEAIGPHGELKAHRQTLDLTRTFDNPDVEVLGKRLEQAMIYEDFAVEAADRLLMRLRAVLR
ncbi:MAG: LPS-assembly lipoprotein LptE [Thermochromatium sp.]